MMIMSGRRLLAGSKENEEEINHKLPWNPRKKRMLATGKKFVYTTPSPVLMSIFFV